MNGVRALGIGFGVLTLVTSLAACTLASPTYITSQEGEQVEGDAGVSPSSSNNGGGGGGSGGGSCSGASFTKPDISKLTACGDGKGHCYDKAKSPLQGLLKPCANANEVCVPDKILAAGGGKLQSCKAITNGPGACVFAPLIPMIAEKGGGNLPPDVCTGGEICIPCNDPTNNNAPSGFCEAIGVYDNACGGAPGGGDAGPPPPPPPPCCITKGKSNGVCIKEEGIPPERRDQTKQDVCAAGDKCVPAAMVSGKPVACSSLLGKGVCMDKCFDDMMSMAGGIGFLSRENCGATELCIPCTFAGSDVPGCQ